MTSESRDSDQFLKIWPSRIDTEFVYGLSLLVDSIAAFMIEILKHLRFHHNHMVCIKTLAWYPHCLLLDCMSGVGPIWEARLFTAGHGQHKIGNWYYVMAMLVEFMYRCQCNSEFVRQWLRVSSTAWVRAYVRCPMEDVFELVTKNTYGAGFGDKWSEYSRAAERSVSAWIICFYVLNYGSLANEIRAKMA